MSCGKPQAAESGGHRVSRGRYLMLSLDGEEQEVMIKIA